MTSILKRVAALFVLGTVSLTSFAANGSGSVLTAAAASVDEEVSSVNDEVSENEESSLAPGSYTATLLYNSAYSDSLTSTTAYQQYYPQAKITVDEDYNYYITFGLKNWSLYDSVICLDQSQNDNLTSEYQYPLRYVPEKWGDNYDLTDFNIASINDEYIIPDSYLSFDNFYDYTDISVDEALDVAYLTFEMEDYSQPLRVFGWCNLASYNSYTSGAHNTFLWIDTDTLSNIDATFDLIENSDETEKYDNLSLVLKHGTADSSTHSVVRFAPVASVSNLFTGNFFIEKNENDDNYTVKYYINYPDYYDGYGAPEDFCFIKSVDYTSVTTNFSYATNKNWSKAAWISYPGNDSLTADSKKSSPENQNATFEYFDVSEDEKGYYLELSYTKNELIFGKYIYFNVLNTTSNKDITCFVSPAITTEGKVEDVICSSTDENTEIKFTVQTNTLILPQGTELNIKVKDDYFAETFGSALFETADWFTLSLVDQDGNAVEPKGSVRLTIECPDGLLTENTVLQVANQDKIFLGRDPSIASGSDKVSGNTWTRTGDSVNGYTYIICTLATASDIKNELTEPGVYRVDAHLRKATLDDTLSMANPAVVHEAYIAVDKDESGNITRTLYLGAKAMSRLGIDNLYIGDLICNDPTSDGDDSVYRESTTYLSFVTNDDGSLADNVGYDAITEWGCVTGMRITLRDESWLENRTCYSMGICSPIMAGLNHVAYSSIKGDTLTNELVFFNAEKVDMTEDDVKALFPYDKSALRRIIEQAEAAANIGSNTITTEIPAEITEAWEVYNNPNATADELEAAADKVAAASGSYESLPTAEITGHSLSVTDDYALSYYVNLGRDAQADENAALEFTLNGKTTTVPVSDAEFVENQGYKFTVNVAAKEMSDTISAKLVLSDGSKEIENSEYSVKEYLNKYISSEESDSAKKELAGVILNYGAYAQVYFNNNTDNLAAELSDVSNVTADSVKDFANNNIELTSNGIEFVGAALTLETKTSVKLYFKLTDALADISDYTFTVNGEAVTAVSGDDYYYITISEISAKNLGAKYQFTVDGQQLWYSPYTYIYNALTKTDANEYADLHNLVKALYVYGEAADSVASSNG